MVVWVGVETVGGTLTEAVNDAGSKSMDLIPKNSKAARPCAVNTEPDPADAVPNGPSGAVPNGPSGEGMPVDGSVGLVKVAG